MKHVIDYKLFENQSESDVFNSVIFDLEDNLRELNDFGHDVTVDTDGFSIYIYYVVNESSAQKIFKPKDNKLVKWSDIKDIIEPAIEFVGDRAEASKVYYAVFDLNNAGKYDAWIETKKPGEYDGFKIYEGNSSWDEFILAEHNRYFSYLTIEMTLIENNIY